MQDLLGDDRGQEPVQGLLGAAIGVVGQVGQGVDQRRPGWASSALRAAICSARALGGDAKDDLGLVLVGPDRAGEGLHLEHAMDVGRERHLGGVRFLVGQRLHADDGLALVRRP